MLCYCSISVLPYLTLSTISTHRSSIGSPVEFIPIVSTSTSTSKINGKKSVVIEDCFEIVGSKKSGRADLIADAHKKGHIRHLRVDVGGIHYDVDVE